MGRKCREGGGQTQRDELQDFHDTGERMKNIENSNQNKNFQLLKKRDFGPVSEEGGQRRTAPKNIQRKSIYILRRSMT